MVQIHLLDNLSLRRHPRHKRFRLMQVNAEIIAHGCTSWLRDAPGALAERAPDNTARVGPVSPYRTPPRRPQYFSFNHSELLGVAAHSASRNSECPLKFSQAMLDFLATHNIEPGVELIPTRQLRSL